MNIYEDQLNSILNTVSIKVENDNTFICIKNKKVLLDSKDANLLSSNSIFELKDEIYKQYHFTDEHNPKNDEKIEDIQFFRQKIQEDRYWAIDATENNGTVVARKNSERARIPVRSFYSVGNFSVSKETIIDTSLQNEDFIHVITSRKVLIENEELKIKNRKVNEDTFIFLFGKNILRDEFGEDTIRFYFNLVPDKETIKKWFSSLSFKLDEREVPYTLKYLSNLKFYKRSDSCVLYVHKQNFNIVAQVIMQCYNSIDSNKVFGQKQPFFTRQLKNGIGFAENPFEKNSSFGSFKSFQILKCIIEYIKCQVKPVTYNPKDCLKFIMEREIFDLEKPYLNQKSLYFYDFDIFDKSSIVSSINFIKTKNQYLNAAQHFAKIIEQKAIWLTPTERTWITYTEKNLTLAEEIKGFRPVNKNEKSGIEFFLASVKYWTNNKKFKGNKPSKSKDVLNDFVFSEHIQEPIPAFTIIDDKNEAKNKGDEIIKKYINIGLPVLNRFANFEFCPTITHGLAFYGYLFLRLHNSKNVPKINQEILGNFQNMKLQSLL